MLSGFLKLVAVFGVIDVLGVILLSSYDAIPNYYYPAGSSSLAIILLIVATLVFAGLSALAARFGL